MKTRTHKARTSFPTPPGTCFILSSLPYATGDYPPNGANRHPFIVLTDSDDHVECIQAQTLSCSREEKSRTHILWTRDVLEIDHPHPPMDPPNVRSQVAELNALMVIPKKVLFDDPRTEICCAGATGDLRPVLRQSEIKRLINAVMQDEDLRIADPFDYDATDPELLSVKDYPVDPTVLRLQEHQHRLRNANLRTSLDAESIEAKRDTGKTGPEKP